MWIDKRLIRMHISHLILFLWIEFFLKLKIYIFLVFIFVGGLSRYNHIELIWGFINLQLAGNKFGNFISKSFEKNN